MKFLLELVSCCASASRPAEQTRFLVRSPQSTAPVARRQRGRKRGRVAPSRSRSVPVAEWRPSLDAISEDNVVPDKDERRVVASGGILKRKVSSSTPRLHVRNLSDDYGLAPLPAIIPTFSPTPFLF